MGATDREIFEDLVMGLKEILDARDLPSISIEEAIAEGWRNPGYFPRFRSAMARISAKTPLKLTVGRILAQGKHAVVEGRQLIHVVEQGVVRWALRRAEDETPKECPVCGGMLTEAGVDFYAALSSEDKKDYCEVCGSFAGIEQGKEDDEPEERGDEVESESYADLLNVTQRQSDRIDDLKEKVDGLERAFGLGEEASLFRSYSSQVTLKEIVKLLGWQPNLLGSYLGCLWGKAEELPIGKALRDLIVENLDQIEKERIAQVRAETRAAKDLVGTLPKIRDALKSMFGRTAKLGERRWPAQSRASRCG